MNQHRNSEEESRRSPKRQQDKGSDTPRGLRKQNERTLGGEVEQRERLNPEDAVDWLVKLDAEDREYVTRNPEDLEGETKKKRREFAEWLAKHTLEGSPGDAVDSLVERGLDRDEAREITRHFIEQDYIVSVKTLLRETVEAYALGMITEEQAEERLRWLGSEKPKEFVEVLQRRKHREVESSYGEKLEDLKEEIHDLRWQAVSATRRDRR